MYRILYFYAPWCNPCKFFKKHFIDVIKKYVEIEYIDVDEQRLKAYEFEIKRTPTAILVDNEGEIERVGLKDLDRLILFLGGKGMKIRFNTECHDNYTGEVYKVGRIAEFSEERAKNIIAKGYGVEVEDDEATEAEDDNVTRVDIDTKKKKNSK